MKFRFCGELDCPDWVLAEIATLSKITSVKMKLLCSQVISGILGSPIDFDKVRKLTSDAKYENSDIKATISALHFIFTSSAKHGVDEESLSNELQQLGLPKESAAALCKVFSDKFAQLQEKLKKESFKLTSISDINWQVDYVMSSSVLNEVNSPSVRMMMKVNEYKNNENKLCTFDVSPEKFNLLLHELKQAYAIMNELTPAAS
ncbi:COMM domain-containing protein 4 [Parasteatoda tepidariorum]|uniref:COMM domain-containing protein 4 n=1 Tax=Parasteatoda tepidariorum TaxID=114398 RepID=UPI00077FC1DE|nr:COMM domain-containing protein 4-like [Parasteatoda tepidariorum]